MSSGKSYKICFDESFEEITKPDIDISKLIIPFSRVFKKYKACDIYSGEEKIPFKERNHDYKMILKQEFV